MFPAASFTIYLHSSTSPRDVDWRGRRMVTGEVPWPRHHGGWCNSETATDISIGFKFLSLKVNFWRTKKKWPGLVGCHKNWVLKNCLGGGFKYVLFSSLFGEWSQFDDHIFQMGWFNHQLVVFHQQTSQQKLSQELVLETIRCWYGSDWGISGGYHGSETTNQPRPFF